MVIAKSGTAPRAFPILHLFFAAVLLVALYVPGAVASDWTCDCDVMFCAEYEKALIETAKLPTPSKISKNLTAITTKNENLIWKRFTDDRGREIWRVLMAFYGNPLNPDPGSLPNPDYRLTTNKWLTAVPEVYDYFKTRPFTVSRLEERLGLPPCSNMPKVVELWVDPTVLYRPSPDPEIIDHEAALDFPWNGNNYIRPNVFDPQRPEDQSALIWDDYCKPIPCKTYEKDGTVVDTHKNDYESWFINRKANIYSKSNNTPYPWTGLGYTFDYGPSPNGVGFSEFVAVPSTVGVQRQEDARTYFKPHRQTLSVAVTGRGRVVSRPPAMVCAGACTLPFSRYARVTLTANASAGWQFKEWGGACSDAGSSPTCSVAMYDNQAVEAVFEAK